MSVKIARRLRRNMTDAERKLWAKLRDRQLERCKFRRQHPLGTYVLDFYCEEYRLVVEVDGSQHTPESDAARTAWLESHGCRVVRFSNLDVLKHLPDVLETIRAVLLASPSPTGRGRRA
ncbi:MAG TPA: endonuclease domain-containing protein [Candidatus Sulfotelmatobacter sp.]|nr:endonuclease domain-containing protein [Candidatus Sulfotelmatobacter sp.]